MSRSALWRQEGNVRQRERRAEEIFDEACEQGRQRGKSALPLWGEHHYSSTTAQEDALDYPNAAVAAHSSSNFTFHWPPPLLQSTIQSPYFQKCCLELPDWPAVVDEIYEQVTHLQPYYPAQQPSTAFCLLLRLLTLRLTAHQLELTLQHPDSPYIRALGFLYLRYVGMPETIWDYIAPAIYDDEEELQVEVQPKLPARGASSSTTTTTVGTFVRQLFAEREYCQTPLPRYPLVVERPLQVRLLQAQKVLERAAQHAQNATQMQYLTTVGQDIMALYSDDEHALQWYSAVIDRVISRNESTGRTWTYPRFMVTFTEYGNTEQVMLGEIDVPEGSWRQDSVRSSSRSEVNTSGGKDRGPYEHRHHHHHRDRSHPAENGAERHRPPAVEEALYEEVRRRERQTVTTFHGRAPRRPNPSLLSSSSHPGSSRDRHYHHHHQHAHHHQDEKDPARRERDSERPPWVPPSGAPGETREPAARKRSAQEQAAVEEKKRRLLAKYG